MHAFFVRISLILMALCGIISCNEKKEERSGKKHLFTEITVDASIHVRRDTSWNYLWTGKVDSAILHSFNLVREAELQPVADELVVDAYLHFGHILLNAGANGLAGVYLQKAVERYHSYHFAPSGYLRNLYATLASNYYAQRNNEKALAYFHKALEIAKSEEEHLFVSSILNNIGMVYLQMDQPARAQSHFDRAQDYFEKHHLPFDELVFSITNNRADAAYRQGHFEQSMADYTFNNKRAQELAGSYDGAERRIVTSSLGMARNSLAMGQPDFAGELYGLADRTLKHLEPKEQVDIKTELLKTGRDIAYTQGEMEVYAELNEKLESLRDSLQQAKLSIMTLATGNMADLQMQVSSLRLEAQRNDLRFSRLLTFSLALVFVLIGGILIINGRKQRKLAAAERRNQQLEEEKLYFQLRHKEQDLNELAAQVSLFNNLAHETREKLKGLANKDVEAQKQELTELTHSYAHHLNDGKVRSLIVENLAKLNSTFYRELEKASSEKLSKKEKELCALFRLQLSDAEIAGMRNVSGNAIRVARSRLRKKLGLTAGQDLSAFLSNLPSGQ